jgi:hypothetical protein
MACRGGLTARPRQDHLQISIEKFDCEAQISGLRGDVAKLKQVSQQRPQGSILGHMRLAALAASLHAMQACLPTEPAAGACHPR